MSMFAISPDLTRSATPVLELPLSTVLLKEDARWPWIILVPRRAGVEHLFDLEPVDFAVCYEEIRTAMRAVSKEQDVARVNLGALGNLVPQLHIHVVGRWKGDPAWPGPVWGVEGKVAYEPTARAELISRLTAQLKQ
jgi:diadenosine tetraphosphate (Ap4A) HIT family hydrolase